MSFRTPHEFNFFAFFDFGDLRAVGGQRYHNPEALQTALQRFQAHPNFPDFRAALLEGPGAGRSWWQTEAMATKILIQVLLLDNMKERICLFQNGYLGLHPSTPLPRVTGHRVDQAPAEQNIVVGGRSH